jgi:cystathionine gamma-lyase
VTRASRAASGRGTRAVHAGLPAPEHGAPFLPGPTFAAPYHWTGDAAPGGYGRYVNPSWQGWEAALSELEGGDAVAFASGMAAASAVLQELLGPGDVLVAPADGYPLVKAVAERHLAPLGVEVRLVPTDEEAVRGAMPGATLVWIETPSNPRLSVLDVTALAGEVHAAGGLLAVDGTLATPLLQPALELGADLSIVSDSKAMTGHSDLVLGHVAARDPAHAVAVRAWRDRIGAIPGPFETWLAHRSLATLDVRLHRQGENALALADALGADGRVTGVRYPGLGPVLCFELPDAGSAQRFLAASELVAEATSFGGVHSSAERRARWGTDDVSEGFIRMSCGLEDTADLVADVLRAVDAASSERTT